MKSDRPVSATTRRGNRIYRQGYTRSGKKIHAENYSFRIKRLGKAHYFNLGDSKRDAEKLADEIAAFLAVKSNTVDDAIARFAPDKVERRAETKASVPTVGEFISRYVARTSHLRPTTVRDNCTALRRITAFVIGLPKNKKKLNGKQQERWRGKVDSASLDAITTDLIESFRQDLIAKAGRDNLKRGRAITTTNFYIRAAGSMFSKKLLKSYSGFSLPSPSPFHEAGSLTEPPHRYVSKIDISALIKAAESELKEEYPDSYTAFLLSLYCGMRRAEIDLLTWEQIDLTKDHIWIRSTEHFTPKAKNSDSRIDILPNVADWLKNYQYRSTDPTFVIPGGNPHYPPRCKAVFRHLLTWLRTNGVDYVQAMHALRKEAGSLMFAQTDSIDRTAEFLRNDTRVALEHYVARKGRLELAMPWSSESDSVNPGPLT